MESDEAHLDVIVVIAAEGVVRVFPENTDGRRKGGNVAVEGAALFRFRVADLGFVQAIFPHEAAGQVDKGGEGEKFRFRETLSHAFERRLQGGLGRFRGLFRELFGELCFLGSEPFDDPLVVEFPKGVPLRGAIVGREARGGQRIREVDREGEKEEDGFAWLHW